MLVLFFVFSVFMFFAFTTLGRLAALSFVYIAFSGAGVAVMFFFISVMLKVKGS